MLGEQLKVAMLPNLTTFFSIVTVALRFSKQSSFSRTFSTGIFVTLLFQTQLLSEKAIGKKRKYLFCTECSPVQFSESFIGNALDCVDAQLAFFCCNNKITL